MMQADIKERLLRANKLAEEEMIQIKSNSELDIAFLETHLKNYIVHKLRLEDTKKKDNINEMIQESVAKSLNVDRDRLKKVDQRSGCDGATSVTSKRVLLFIAIQKELSIQFPAEKMPYIETIKDLVTLVFSLMSLQENI